jgi:hypothetical protein
MQRKADIEKEIASLAEKGGAVFFPESLKLLKYWVTADVLSWGIFHFHPATWIKAYFNPHDYEDNVNLPRLSQTLMDHPLVSALLRDEFKEGTTTTATRCLASKQIPDHPKALKTHEALLASLRLEFHGCLLVLHQGTLAVSLSFFRNVRDFTPADMEPLWSFNACLKKAISRVRTVDWYGPDSNARRNTALISIQHDGTIYPISTRANRIVSQSLRVGDLPALIRRCHQEVNQLTKLGRSSHAGVFVADIHPQQPYSIYMVEDGESLRIAIFEASQSNGTERATLTEAETTVLHLRARGFKGDALVKELNGKAATRITAPRSVENYLRNIKQVLRLSTLTEVDAWYQWIGTVSCRDQPCPIPLTHCRDLILS